MKCGDLVTGSLKSNELSTGRSPLLLSLAAQGTLGLQKDVRVGTCYLEDYDDTELLDALADAIMDRQEKVASKLCSP